MRGGPRFVGVVGRGQPVEPLVLDYVYAPDASTVTHSAEIGSLTYSAGDYLHSLLLTHGNATFHGPSVGVWTNQLSTIAPAAPRRAYAYDRIADETGDDSLAWTWDAPGVDAVALTIATHEPGLALWAQDWWTGGPDTGFSSPGFDLHRAVVVFTWSDAGTTVDGATLIFRSDAGDVPSVGVTEIWSIPGAAAPGSTTTDIDVTALSGDVQWATWIDIYSV